MAEQAEQTNLIETMASRYGVDRQTLLSTLTRNAFITPYGFNQHWEPTQDQALSLLIMADQYNLNPLKKEIVAYPGRNGSIVPVVGIEGWFNIISSHPDVDGFVFKTSESMTFPQDGLVKAPEWMEVTFHRKNWAHPVTIREYLDEVYRPPFVDPYTGEPNYGPWQKQTKRMLRHKTLIQVARIVLGLTGIYDQDEAERIVEAERDVLKQGLGAQQKPTPAPVKAETKSTSSPRDKVTPIPLKTNQPVSETVPQPAPVISEEKPPTTPKVAVRDNEEKAGPIPAKVPETKADIENLTPQELFETELDEKQHKIVIQVIQRCMAGVPWRQGEDYLRERFKGAVLFEALRIFGSKQKAHESAHASDLLKISG